MSVVATSVIAFCFAFLNLIPKPKINRKIILSRMPHSSPPRELAHERLGEYLTLSKRAAIVSALKESCAAIRSKIKEDQNLTKFIKHTIIFGEKTNFERIIPFQRRKSHDNR